MFPLKKKDWNAYKEIGYLKKIIVQEHQVKKFKIICSAIEEMSAGGTLEKKKSHAKSLPERVVCSSLCVSMHCQSSLPI